VCARRRRHVVAKPRETDGGCVVDVLDVVHRARASSVARARRGIARDGGIGGIGRRDECAS